MSSDAFQAGLELPAIDERLVAPETPYEMWDGELVHVPPADPPHAIRHVQLAALIEAHTGPEFESALDLLTRTSKIDDIAPDVSIYPDGPDPRTGGRQLEHLAFEIVNTQSLTNAGRKAAKLAWRGVRRVFAVDVERSRVLEWSAALGIWRVLDPAGYIDDPALAVPLPIEALIRNAKADDAVARALLAKRNPVLVHDRAKGEAEGRAKGEAEGRAKGEAEGRAKGEAEGRAKGEAEGRAKGEAEGRAKGEAEGRAKGEAEGRAQGKAEAVIVLLTARGIALDGATRERILGERDPLQLDRWIAGAATGATLADLLTEA